MNKKRSHLQPHRSLVGFTLMELLIVVAIVAVLVAITIPIFASQAARARIAVDMANAASAKELAAAQYLTGDLESDVDYFFDESTNTFVAGAAISGQGYGQSTAEGIAGKTSKELGWDDVTVCPPNTGSAGNYIKVRFSGDGKFEKLSWSPAFDSSTGAGRDVQSVMNVAGILSAASATVNFPAADAWGQTGGYVYVSKDGTVRVSSLEVGQALEEAGVLTGTPTKGSSGHGVSEYTYKNQTALVTDGEAWDIYQLNYAVNTDGTMSYTVSALKGGNNVNDEIAALSGIPSDPYTIGKPRK